MQQGFWPDNLLAYTENSWFQWWVEITVIRLGKLKNLLVYLSAIQLTKEINNDEQLLEFLIS